MDFETKLTHTKRVLDEIDERLHLIEMTSDDPEMVQNQLDQCSVVPYSLSIVFFNKQILGFF